jgi:hypothetical protein
VLCITEEQLTLARPELLDKVILVAHHKMPIPHTARVAAAVPARRAMHQIPALQQAQAVLGRHHPLQDHP